MLNVTSAFQYAMRLLIFLNNRRSSGFISLLEISRAIDVSEGYLRKIASILVKHGALESRLGPGGGVRVLPESGKIKVGRIQEWVDGPLMERTCPLVGLPYCPADEKCPVANDCQWYFETMRDHLRDLPLEEIRAHPCLESSPGETVTDNAQKSLSAKE